MLQGVVAGWGSGWRRGRRRWRRRRRRDFNQIEKRALQKCGAFVLQKIDGLFVYLRLSISTGMFSNYFI